jgi:hypothetical protein
MPKTYLPKKSENPPPEIDRESAIKLLIDSRQPMMLKYINGDSIVFEMYIYVAKSGPNKLRIKGTATIPWEKRDIFISSIGTTYVYPSKLIHDWITVKID